ncbi:MAG: helix-turn-helix transcriptional regulator [Spirochaetes bacterium]|nr:helix-turn-helix transcriptional regulator [Spirochaetota bacterium]
MPFTYTLSNEIKRHAIPFRMSKSENNTGFSAHTHDFFEITYVYAGSGTVETGDTSYKYRSHQFNFTPPSIAHRIVGNRNTTHRRASLSVSDRLPMPVIASFDPAAFIKQLTAEKIFMLDVPREYVDEVERILESMYREVTLPMKYSASVIVTELTRLLIIIHRIRYGEKPVLQGFENMHPAVSEALIYMEKNYYQMQEMSEIMKHVPFHKKYFIALFKKNVGYTPVNYLNRIRIEKSCEALRAGRQSVTDIAYDAGFNDISYFNRQFKKLVGMPPRQFQHYIQTQPSTAACCDRLHFPLSLGTAKKR